jgi:hypothetical protein
MPHAFDFNTSLDGKISWKSASDKPREKLDSSALQRGNRSWARNGEPQLVGGVKTLELAGFSP